jgi:archaetidylinositol phosphate synthase
VSLLLEKLRENFTSTLAVITKPVQLLSPNLITLLGLLASLAAAYFYLQATSQTILLGALLLIISGYFDVADGFVAKKKNATTKFGALLDSVTDRYADSAIIAALILSHLVEPAVGIIALIGFLLVSYVRARASSLGVEMATIGLAERAERLIILIVASLIAGTIGPLGVMDLAVILLAILTHFTVLQRMIYAWRKLS